VKIIREESNLDVRPKRGPMVSGYTCVALIPPTKVYIDTPTGSKNVAAMICIPVLVMSAMA